LSKIAFDFPVVGGTTRTAYEDALARYHELGVALKAIGDRSPECHDEAEIARFVVGLIFVMQDSGPKSDESYAYVRTAAAGKNMLIELASQIIVQYDSESRRRNADAEIEDVKNGILGI